MEITKRRLADIVPYAANAKKHDKRQINNVAESIKQYGFVQPIVIDRDGVIVIGHCRALAAKKTGHGRSAVRLRGRSDTGAGERPAAGG